MKLPAATRRTKRSSIAALVLFFSLAVVFAVAAMPYVQRYRLPLAEAAGIYMSFLLSLLLLFSPAAPPFAFAREPWRPRAQAFLLVPLLVSPYLIYAVFTNDFQWSALARLCATALVIVGIYIAFPVDRLGTLAWQDVLVAVLLIGAVLSHFLAGIWNVPVHLDFMTRLFLTALGAWCWSVVRPVPDLGFTFKVTPALLLTGLRNFLGFAAFAIPAGLLLSFTAWNPRWHGFSSFVLAYLEIFVFIALLEELFFRGFLQNLLSRRIGPLRGQALVACLFGLFHILHAPFPNWRYVLLASVAGWFYGSAYRTTQTLMCPALVHAAVDTIWRTWFTRG